MKYYLLKKKTIGPDCVEADNITELAQKLLGMGLTPDSIQGYAVLELQSEDKLLCSMRFWAGLARIGEWVPKELGPDDYMKVYREEG